MFNNVSLMKNGLNEAILLITVGNVSIGSIADEKKIMMNPSEIFVIVFVSSVLNMFPSKIPKNKKNEIIMNNAGSNNGIEVAMLSKKKYDAAPKRIVD